MASTKQATAAKRAVLENFKDYLGEADAVNYGGEFDYAIPVTTTAEDGTTTTTYVTVELTAKNPTTYTNSKGVEVKAFDPFAAKAKYDEYEHAKKAAKAAKAAEKEAAKKAS